jgi:hypothetical protein
MRDETQEISCADNTKRSERVEYEKSEAYESLTSITTAEASGSL